MYNASPSVMSLKAYGRQNQALLQDAHKPITFAWYDISHGLL